MANEQDGAIVGRLSVDARRSVLRKMAFAIIPDGFKAEALTQRGRQEVRDGIDAILALDDFLKGRILK